VTVDDAARPGGRTESSATELGERLRALVAEDGLRPGDPLPPETALAQRFGVSRSKVREALKLLEQDGLVHAIQGRGRFVSPVGSLRVERPVTIYESITELLGSRGYEITTLVLDVAEREADEHVAAALDIAVGAPVIRLTRLRLGDDEPMVFSVNTIVRDALPGPVGFRDWATSLSAALEAHGHRIVSSAARLTATNLPAGDTERFGLQGLDPWLLVEESCVTQDGSRVLHALDYHRGSEIGFNVLRRR
jgi:GntR family transcriptional regulator